MAYSDSIRTSNGSFSLTATLTDALHTENVDGWAALSETCTYASASTITIATGGASRFQKGDKLRLTNSTLKYFNIITVADTLLTVSGGSDYSLANAAITGVSLSRVDRPFGFPAEFNWSPSFTGFSANPGSGIYTFKIVNGWVVCNARMPSNGTSNATTFRISAPVTPRTVTNGSWGVTWFDAVDNGSSLTAAGKASVLSADSNIYIDSNMGGAAWTAANGKRASFTNLSYPI
jgi:hypothetical protein